MGKILNFRFKKVSFRIRGVEKAVIINEFR